MTVATLLLCHMSQVFKTPFPCMIFIVVVGNKIIFCHFLVAAYFASSSFFDKMNRRRAAAALLLMRQHSYGHQYWVNPINTKREECGEYHTLYKDLRNYPDWFYTYYCMTTQSFDYILM